MSSTLCPAHLHIYHTLRNLVEEHSLAEEGFAKVSKGTRFMRVPGLSSSKPQNRSTPESLLKYAEFFNMIQQDSQHSKGVTLTQHPNPVSGVADLVTVTFDLRALQMEQMAKQQQTIGITPQQVNATMMQEQMMAQPQQV